LLNLKITVFLVVTPCSVVKCSDDVDLMMK
jgi:hypothetical protein